MAKKNTIENESGAVVESEVKSEVAIFTPKLVRIVTLPLFKWQLGMVKYFRFDAPMHVGKTIKEGEGAKKKEPAILASVTDMETGEKGEIILGAVLRSILEEEYPNDAYVGKAFAIKQRKIPGKDYNGFDVAEIEA